MLVITYFAVLHVDVRLDCRTATPTDIPFHSGFQYLRLAEHHKICPVVTLYVNKYQRYETYCMSVETRGYCTLQLTHKSVSSPNCLPHPDIHSYYYQAYFKVIFLLLLCTVRENFISYVLAVFNYGNIFRNRQRFVSRANGPLATHSCIQQAYCIRSPRQQLCL